MKNKTIIFALLAVLAFTATGLAAFSIEIKGDLKTAPQALFAGVVANFFGVDSKVVLDIREQQSMTPIQVIGSLYLAGEEGTYLPQAASEFKRGRGWAKLKNRGHIPPGQLKKLGKHPTNSSNERVIFIRFMEDCYRIPERKVVTWLGYGMPYDEIILCVNFAYQAQIKPDRVVELRHAGRDWNWMCRTWKVSERELGSLASPRRYGKKIKVKRK
jgi:hypothetical protein